MRNSDERPALRLTRRWHTGLGEPGDRDVLVGATYAMILTWPVLLPSAATGQGGQRAPTTRPQFAAQIRFLRAFCAIRNSNNPEGHPQLAPKSGDRRRRPESKRPGKIAQAGRSKSSVGLGVAAGYRDRDRDSRR